MGATGLWQFKPGNKFKLKIERSIRRTATKIQQQLQNTSYIAKKLELSISISTKFKPGIQAKPLQEARDMFAALGWVPAFSHMYLYEP
jgi:DNA polymerase III alpha subunit